MPYWGWEKQGWLNHNSILVATVGVVERGVVEIEINITLEGVALPSWQEFNIICSTFLLLI